MEATRTGRQKLMEWVRRYLPCEIVGTTAYINAARSIGGWEVDGEPVATFAAA